MFRIACMFAIGTASACAFPVQQPSSPGIACITDQRVGSGRTAYHLHWIGDRSATAPQVDAELARWSPAAAEETRGNREGKAAKALVIAGVGLAGLTLLELITVHVFAGEHFAPYDMIPFGVGFAATITGVGFILHNDVHYSRAKVAYNAAASERDECPLATGATPIAPEGEAR